MRLARRWAALAALLAVVVCAGAFHSLWMTWLGSYLVVQEKPEKADIIVVLGGDFRGDRILTASKLATDGYAPHVLVSGSGPIYGFHESDLAVAFAVSKGFNPAFYIKLRYPAVSTEDEAGAVAVELHRLGAKSFLLVTSSFHTRRATRIFHQKAPGIPFRVVASPDPYFTPSGWWKNREGQKTFLSEWEKTFANWAGD